MSASAGPLRRLDGWLWRRGICHPLLLPLLRHQFCGLGLLLLVGLGLLAAGQNWIFWTAVGFGLMTFILWELVRFFLRRPLQATSMGQLPVILLRWSLRLGLTALLLYAALVYWQAPPLALVAGLALAQLVALTSYARAYRRAAQDVAPPPQDDPAAPAANE